MPKPTIHDFEQAALWLDECKAGVTMEAPCRIVATWLRQEAQCHAIRQRLIDEHGGKDGIAYSLDATP